MWYGIKRGASMSGLAGEEPFAIAVAQVNRYTRKSQ